MEFEKSMSLIGFRDCGRTLKAWLYIGGAGSAFGRVVTCPVIGGQGPMRVIGWGIAG